MEDHSRAAISAHSESPVDWATDDSMGGWQASMLDAGRSSDQQGGGCASRVPETIRLHPETYIARADSRGRDDVLDFR